MDKAQQCINDIRIKLDQLDQDPDQYKKLVREILFILASLPEEHTDYAIFRMTGRNLQNSYKAKLAVREPNFKNAAESVKLHLEFLLNKYTT